MSDQPNQPVTFVSDIDFKVSPPNERGFFKITVAVAGQIERIYEVDIGVAQRLRDDLGQVIRMAERQQPGTD